jgi:hypothetical protein
MWDNGLSKVIIIRNLKALDENMRPVHCIDLKREKIFVKDGRKKVLITRF